MPFFIDACASRSIFRFQVYCIQLYLIQACIGLLYRPYRQVDKYSSLQLCLQQLYLNTACLRLLQLHLPLPKGITSIPLYDSLYKACLIFSCIGEYILLHMDIKPLAYVYLMHSPVVGHLCPGDKDTITVLGIYFQMQLSLPHYHMHKCPLFIYDKQ